MRAFFMGNTQAEARRVAPFIVGPSELSGCFHSAI